MYLRMYQKYIGTDALDNIDIIDITSTNLSLLCLVVVEAFECKTIERYCGQPGRYQLKTGR